jgi:ABC-type Zn uptake system ZnuABC Zn-binding protein ZnuA
MYDLDSAGIRPHPGNWVPGNWNRTRSGGDVNDKWVLPSLISRIGRTASALTAIIEALLLVAFVIVACGTGKRTVETPKVVATTSIVGDVVAAVGGSAIDLTVLLPRGTDPHGFEPSPRDVVALSGSDVVFINGAGLEEFLEPLLVAADVESSVIDLSSGLATRGLDHDETGNHRTASHSTEKKPIVDPHVWLDPNNVVQWTNEIEEALVGLDPGNAEHYAARADSFRALLRRLDIWIQEQLDGIPAERRLLVSDHAALGYFADRYGFAQVGSIYPGFSTLSEPSAKELSRLEDAIRARNVSAIFVGAAVNPRLAQRLADDIDVRVVRLYVGSLSSPNEPAPSYIELLRYDVTAIASALKDGP